MQLFYLVSPSRHTFFGTFILDSLEAIRFNDSIWAQRQDLYFITEAHYLIGYKSVYIPTSWIREIEIEINRQFVFTPAIARVNGKVKHTRPSVTPPFKPRLPCPDD